jgi:hypothetical protein
MMSEANVIRFRNETIAEDSSRTREIDLVPGHEIVIRPPVMSGNEVAVLGRAKLQQTLNLKDGGIICRLLRSGGKIPL